MKDYKVGFVSMEKETSVNNLPIQGKIPKWLKGTLFRIGPAKFETAKGKLNHWFDGFAMLHSFSFQQGNVSYKNKFLESNSFQAAKRNGKIAYREFATDPCMSIFKKFFSLFSSDLTDNCNVNVTKIADKYLALTETTLPIIFDQEFLKTKGHFIFDDNLDAQITTAHPHFDFATREIFSYMTKFSINSHYLIYNIRNGTKRCLISKIPVKEPAYMHSFALTRKYIILAEFPLVVNPLDLAFSNKPFIKNYKWKKENGTRFIVIDRGNGNIIANIKSRAFFAFHHINAFEENEKIILDIAAYGDSTIIDSLFMNRIFANNHLLPRPNFIRFKLDLNNNIATQQRIIEAPIELPRINYKYNARDYNFAYGTSFNKDGDFLNQLIKVDIKNKKTSRWHRGGFYPSEPVFVPSPEGKKEDDGVILSVALDSKQKKSSLIVLDAKNFKEIGRALLSHFIPFGFHGNFYN